jgi:hypothetical protein
MQEGKNKFSSLHVLYLYKQVPCQALGGGFTGDEGRRNLLQYKELEDTPFF